MTASHSCIDGASIPSVNLPPSTLLWHLWGPQDCIYLGQNYGELGEGDMGENN